MVMLAVTISTIICTYLSRDLALLSELNTATMSGMAIADHEAYSIISIRSQISDLQWITYWTVGGALALLCAGVFTIIWFGARTIMHQNRELQLRVVELSALNNMVQRQLGLEENRNQRQQMLPLLSNLKEISLDTG